MANMNGIEVNIDNEEHTEYVFRAPRKVFYRIAITIAVILLVCYLYFFLMGLGMHLYSDLFEAYSTVYMVIGAVVVALNAAVILKLRQRLKYLKRYEKYYDIIKGKDVEIIDDLCFSTSIPARKVIQDLRDAVNKQLIPEGHFSTDNLAFMTSDKVYEHYKDNQPVYDRYYKQLIEERIRIEARPQEIRNIMATGQDYIDFIRESKQLIHDKELFSQLEYMEHLVEKIFHEVDLDPSQASELGLLINYYLPTTEKLLSSYVEIEEKKIEGDNINKTKDDIKHGIDLMTETFENILNKLFEKQELDIASDIAVMETIVKQER